jgi:hypothetical protein
MVSTLVLVVALATLAAAYTPFESQWDHDVDTPYGVQTPYGTPYGVQTPYGSRYNKYSSYSNMGRGIYDTPNMGRGIHDSPLTSGLYNSPMTSGIYGTPSPFTSGIYGTQSPFTSGIHGTPSPFTSGIYGTQSPFTTGYGYGINKGMFQQTPFNMWNPLKTMTGGMEFDPRYQSPVLKSLLRGGLNMPFQTRGIFGGLPQQLLNTPFDSEIEQLYNPLTGVQGLHELKKLQLLARLQSTGEMTPFSVSPFGIDSVKEVKVCPEVDGGISLVSCIADSHAEGFKCLKQIEEHPRYQMCLAKPSIKKTLKDWHVTALTWHKELLKCTTVRSTGIDQGEPIVDVPIVDVPEINDPFNTPFGMPFEQQTEFGLGGRVNPTMNQWNQERLPVQGTSTCIRHIRGSINQCTVQAMQCPIFMQCHESMPIKQLKNKTEILQGRFVRMVEKCVQGTLGF